MRYVPNLIPENAKVLPEYFKGDIYKAANKNQLRDGILWFLGIVFFICALAFIKDHPLLFLLFGLLGFILIPPGHEFVEKKLRFNFTPKIKTAAASFLFIGSGLLSNHYFDIDEQKAYQQKLLDEKAATEKAIAVQKEQQKKDSLTYYIQQSNQLVEKHKLEEAQKQLQYASIFANNQSDKNQIEKANISITSVRANDLIKAGQYKVALAEIDNLLNANPDNADLLYNRAVCYSKTGKVQEAVNDLKVLIKAGNSDAQKLHEKINPLQKRVIDHVVRCRDGTTSDATGRGACSHHGGVANWNEPVYGEYRKYD
jgi:tetratricopeptide (TPR) repeat protein